MQVVVVQLQSLIMFFWAGRRGLLNASLTTPSLGPFSNECNRTFFSFLHELKEASVAWIYSGRPENIMNRFYSQLGLRQSCEHLVLTARLTWEMKIQKYCPVLL